MTQSLTQIEIDGIADSLGRLDKGYLPYPIFNQVARLVALPNIELIPVRQTPEGSIDVLLTQRGSEDVFWANQWHNPGTIILSTDEKNSFTATLSRLFQDELEIELQPCQYVDTVFFDNLRGAVVATLYYCDLSGQDIRVGQWHPVADLPDSIVVSQIPLIQSAVEMFTQKLDKESSKEVAQ